MRILTGKEKTQFKKGVSGNPSGRPVDTLQHFLRDKKNLPQSPAFQDKHAVADVLDGNEILCRYGSVLGHSDANIRMYANYTNLRLASVSIFTIRVGLRYRFRELTKRASLQ